MILSDKNIELQLLEESTLEVLRNWRNSKEVNKFMDYQKEISKEDQRSWFENLPKEKNYYFIIRDEKKPIGMIHLGEIDESSKTAQSGMFIGEEQYRGTGVALKASLLLLKFAFEELGLIELFAKVKDDNKQAQHYNRLLGFQEKNKLNDSFSQWSLKKSDFDLKKTFLKQLTA
jgi:UDP-4-amino-4,6-dideoxy-N-acetyl-beta-L-altrosamine N-acetyltransferase